MLIHQKEMGIEMFNIRLAWYGKMRDERKEGNKKIVTTDKLELFFFYTTNTIRKNSTRQSHKHHRKQAKMARVGHTRCLKETMCPFT
jgi:hypothetical protein